MRLSREQRKAVYAMFGGRCAYCGADLGERWHADHLAPIFRDWDSPPARAGADELENLVPACAPCNIDKSTFSIAEWRAKLERSTAVLARNQPTYRHAKRFGLVQETGARVVFYFETKKEQP